MTNKATPGHVIKPSDLSGDQLVGIAWALGPPEGQQLHLFFEAPGPECESFFTFARPINQIPDSCESDCP